MLTKLFSKITYAQRNELLKIDTPLSSVCNSVTLQEAERRMLLDGEKRLAASQEEPEAVVISAHTVLHANNNNINNNNHNTTNPERTNTSRHSRVLSPEGWNLVFSPPWLCIIEKSLQNYLLKYFLICIYVLSEKAEEEKRKPKSTWFYQDICKS